MTELETVLAHMKNAGCDSAELKKAKLLYESDNAEELVKHLRRCRCDRMEELHESQRKVDSLDFLIHQTGKHLKEQRRTIA